MINIDNPSTWSVLIVDDEIDNLEVVADTLEFYGVKVKTASNGAAALDLLSTFSPTLILTDLSMPGIDGWQLRVRIRQMPDKQGLPIIAITAHAMVGDKERALSAGFDGYLTKPINVMSLIQDLKATLKAIPPRAIPVMASPIPHTAAPAPAPKLQTQPVPAVPLPDAPAGKVPDPAPVAPVSAIMPPMPPAPAQQPQPLVEQSVPPPAMVQPSTTTLPVSDPIGANSASEEKSQA